MNIRKFHKYISLAVSLQLLLWTISGIYFSFNKIENVRGEQYYKPEQIQENDTSINQEKISHESAFAIIEDKTILIPVSIELIKEAKSGSEYRGRELPLYKVITNNANNEEINVYIDPYTAEIVAIRSQQWRIWDLMWGFHIMDWVERDNMSNILLKLFSFFALLTALTGIILFFRKK